MKLGKLLAAGKSIMSGRTDISYRSSKQIYLPKFGSAKNPFTSEASGQAPERMASPAPEVATEQHPPASGSTAEPGHLASCARSVDNAETTQSAIENRPAICGWVAPSNNPKGPVEAERPRLGTNLSNSRTVIPAFKQSENTSTLQRFNAFLRSTMGKARPSDKSLKNQKGTATQTELSLDSVKVVHNDLSDVDVEVVPIKSRSGAPELPAPKKSWEYVGERLFGVETT